MSSPPAEVAVAEAAAAQLADGWWWWKTVWNWIGLEVEGVKRRNFVNLSVYNRDSVTYGPFVQCLLNYSGGNFSSKDVTRIVSLFSCDGGGWAAGLCWASAAALWLGRSESWEQQRQLKQGRVVGPVGK